MINIIGHNIISPLGLTSEENYQSVIRGRSALHLYDDKFGLHEAFCGSLINRGFIYEKASESGIDDDYSLFEKLAILSASGAIKDSGINPSDPNTIFILSTTKGNVDLLEENMHDERCYLHTSALRIADYFGNKANPIVVSNACISGVCAQIEGVRQLLSGLYSTAIIIGCDILSKFIISGFQSFKALSTKPCKPYDKDRTGLNLGEAAGTIILRKENSPASDWHYVASSIHNDANHISGPSRTGEGAFRVLQDIVRQIDKSELAFLNAHGTATAYNDEMESIAIGRADLSDIPLSGLKGYYGHTLGAAGIIETILSIMAIDEGIIIATRGYDKSGTSGKLYLSNQTRHTDKRSFIKILSGFGGSNAGICYEKGGRR